MSHSICEQCGQSTAHDTRCADCKSTADDWDDARDDSEDREDVALTNYPEVDIETHREIATTNKLLSGVILLASVSAFLHNGPFQGIGLVLMALAAYASAVRLETQTDEWEAALEEVIEQ